jgi:hypothetical protein
MHTFVLSPPCCHRSFRDDSGTELWARSLPVCYALFSSIIGTQSVLFGKSVSMLLRTTLNGTSQLGYWYFWVSLLLFGLFACFWLTRFSKAMALFPIIIMVPVLQVVWMVFSITTGGIFYREFQAMSALQIGMFCTGVVLLMAGIVLLTSSQQLPMKVGWKRSWRTATVGCIRWPCALRTRVCNVLVSMLPLTQVLALSCRCSIDAQEHAQLHDVLKKLEEGVADDVTPAALSPKGASGALDTRQDSDDDFIPAEPSGRLSVSWSLEGSQRMASLLVDDSVDVSDELSTGAGRSGAGNDVEAAIGATSVGLPVESAAADRSLKFSGLRVIVPEDWAEPAFPSAVPQTAASSRPRQLLWVSLLAGRLGSFHSHPTRHRASPPPELINPPPPAPPCLAGDPRRHGRGLQAERGPELWPAGRRATQPRNLCVQHADGAGCEEPARERSSQQVRNTSRCGHTAGGGPEQCCIQDRRQPPQPTLPGGLPRGLLACEHEPPQHAHGEAALAGEGEAVIAARLHGCAVGCGVLSLSGLAWSLVNCSWHIYGLLGPPRVFKICCIVSAFGKTVPSCVGANRELRIRLALLFVIRAYCEGEMCALLRAEEFQIQTQGHFSVCYPEMTSEHGKA